jgi:hypothetical protein
MFRVPVTAGPRSRDRGAGTENTNVGTDDLHEALVAYVERRPPVFKGR